MASRLKMENPSFKTAFEADTDLQQYRSNALSLFALSLYLRLDDISDFAASAISEGPDDKKVDICYLDLNEKRAVIAQSYFAERWSKKSAPANKASDLNTAMAWLLSVGDDRIPAHLRTKAIDLRRALMHGDIDRLELLYIHNCQESANVDGELKAAAEATRDKVRSLIGDKPAPVITFKEFGVKTIEDLYKSRDSEILVDEWLSVPTSILAREDGAEWHAVLASVPGTWVQGLYKTHGDRLFSANYRDYLGSSNRRGNINYQITQTAESEPYNFWVYNNGITALTHEMKIRGKRIKIRGLSIINGAQTSGALSEAKEDAAKTAKVMIRFVACDSRDLIDKIILYNNTQNDIRPADRRSNDPIQRNLRADFAKRGIVYIHRRSSARTPRNAITAAAIAPALCAFHGEPQVALRNARDIFNEDAVYERVFPHNLCVAHIFLVKSLSAALDLIKSELNTNTTAL